MVLLVGSYSLSWHKMSLARLVLRVGDERGLMLLLPLLVPPPPQLLMLVVYFVVVLNLEYNMCRNIYLHVNSIWISKC